jgi:DNA replication protein DnaC
MKPSSPLQLQLEYLRLGHVAEHYEALAKEAAEKRWPPIDYLQRLIEGEYNARQDRARERRVRSARFPVVKTLAGFRWDWPKKIDEMKIKHLFRLDFVPKKANVIFCGLVGTGKTHLCTALSYEACQRGYSVLFTTAVDALNHLHAAAANHRLQEELKRYLAPDLLYIDELGYLPMDKAGADLIFQIVSQRYERGSIVLTTNKVPKLWPEIFNNDAMLASALLDRLLHNAEVVLIEGKSYRMKDRIEPPL